MLKADFIVKEKVTIREALAILDAIAHLTSCLFVVDDDGVVKGSLSDGDIRRGMLAGAGMESPVSDVMHRDFKFLRQDNLDVASLKFLRERQIRFIPVLDSLGHLVDTVNLMKYRSRLPVSAVLMAGGKGERLRPLTEHTPKPLLPVGGKAIIDHNVDRLISFGIRDIRVSVHYLAQQIEAHFSNPVEGVQVQCIREKEYLGTIGAVRQMPPFCEDTVLVMNSDLFTNIDLEDFYLHFLENLADFSVAAVPYNVSIPYGILELDGRRVKKVIEKPVFNYYAGAGIYLMKRSVIETIPADTFFHATDLIDKLAGEGRNVIRYPLNGTWVDIGSLKEYQKACDLAGHL